MRALAHTNVGCIRTGATSDGPGVIATPAGTMIVAGAALVGSAAIGYAVAGVVGAVAAPVLLTAGVIGWTYQQLPGTHGTGTGAMRPSMGGQSMGAGTRPPAMGRTQSAPSGPPHPPPAPPPAPTPPPPHYNSPGFHFPPQRRRFPFREVNIVQEVVPYVPHGPTVYLLTDRFADQFPGISSLAEPLRSKILNQIDNILTDYLTNLVPWGPASKALRTHTWAAWADYLASWANDLEKSYAAYGASTAAAAVKELRSIEAKLRWWQNNGAYYWDGPWPRAYLGRAQYESKFLSTR